MAVKVTDVDKVERTLPEVKEVGARIEKRVGDEAERATQAEQALRTSLSEHEKAAEESFQEVNFALQAEIDRARSAEQNLNTAIQNESERAQGAESTLQSSIEEEKNRATSAESALQESINTEVSRAKKAEEELGKKISSEADRAKGEESRIEGLLQDEVSRAKEAESALSQDIEEETNRAEQAEASLTSALSQEQEQRILGDTTLDSKIDKEIQDRESGDSQNSQAIQAETSRAQEAESALQANIDAEENRAVQVEGQLSTRLTSIEEKIPNQASAVNQLADKEFVNSSIQQMAANRVTYDAQGSPFPTREILLSSQTYYHNGEAYTPDEHDYALVTADEGAPTPFTGGQTRFEWTGSGWEYAYGINERPFTSEEWAAIESGVTKEKVAEIGTKLPMNTTQNSLYGTDSGGSQIMIPRSSFATSAQGQKADTAYQKPEGGIPKADLESSVQSSLEKANSAYQKPSEGIGESDLSQSVNSSLDLADTSYQKPSTGIPKSDLSSSVQESLNKADTALQGAGTYPDIVAGSGISNNYNLGAFDTYVDNGDGTVTVTRKTGRYDVLIENFVVGEGCFQILNFSLPNTDKYFIIGGSSGSSEHATSNVYPLGAWGVDDTFYIPSDNYLRVFDSSFTKDATGLAQFKAALEAAGGMYILYETDTSYPEKLPANVPLNTLDANMSDIVRDEVEKTLNLADMIISSKTYNSGQAGIDAVSIIKVEVGQTYRISYHAQKTSGVAGNGGIILIDSDTTNIPNSYNEAFQIGFQVNEETDVETSITHVATKDYIQVVIGSTGVKSQTIVISDLMVSEGDNNYPYQPYNGAIVHEKQLNDALEDYPTNDELNTKLEDYLPLMGGTINGTINATGQVQEAGQRVYSPNNKPTKSDIGLGNVDNVQQYSSKNPPPYPVTSVNGKTGAVQVTEIGGVAFNKRSDGQIVDNNASTHYISQRVTLWSGSQRVTGVSNFHFTVPQQVFRELVIYGNVEGETGIRCIHVPAYYRGGGGEDTGFAQATYSWARGNLLDITNLDVYIDTAISAGRYQCHISAHTGVLISASGVASSLTPIIVQLVEGII